MCPVRSGSHSLTCCPPDHVVTHRRLDANFCGLMWFRRHSWAPPTQSHMIWPLTVRKTSKALVRWRLTGSIFKALACSESTIHVPILFSKFRLTPSSWAAGGVARSWWHLLAEPWHTRVNQLWPLCQQAVQFFDSWLCMSPTAVVVSNPDTLKFDKCDQIWTQTWFRF